MKKTRHSETEMVEAVRQLDSGISAEEIAREHGISVATLYKWKSKYSGVDINQVNRMKELKHKGGLKTKVAIGVSTVGLLIVPLTRVSRNSGALRGVVKSVSTTGFRIPSSNATVEKTFELDAEKIRDFIDKANDVVEIVDSLRSNASSQTYTTRYNPSVHSGVYKEYNFNSNQLQSPLQLRPYDFTLNHYAPGYDYMSPSRLSNGQFDKNKSAGVIRPYKTQVRLESYGWKTLPNEVDSLK